MLIQAVNGVHQARQAEDTAFKRFSGKDFASDDLKREDALEDKYMSTALGILNGLLYLLVLLFAIEDRAKLYYISGGKTSGGDTPTQGGTSGGGTSTEGGSGSGNGTGTITPGGGGSSSGGDNGGSTGGSTGGGTTPPGGGDDHGDMD